MSFFRQVLKLNCNYLEAIKELETLYELAVKYEVSPVMISRWKKEFIENSAAAFEAPKVDGLRLKRKKTDTFE